MAGRKLIISDGRFEQACGPLRDATPTSRKRIRAERESDRSGWSQVGRDGPL